MTDTNDKLKTPPIDTNVEHEEVETRLDLVWDNEAPGLCVRVYGDGSKSFIFVHRVNDRQRFVRIGKSPIWSLEAARKRAKELRGVIGQGGNPDIYNQEPMNALRFSPLRTSSATFPNSLAENYRRDRRCREPLTCIGNKKPTSGTFP